MPGTSGKRVVKKDTKSGAKSGAKPEAEVKAEAKAEPKVEPKVEPKIEPKVEPKVEVKAEAETTPEAKPAGDSKKRTIPEELERELKFKTALTELRTELATQTKMLKDLKTGIKKLETSYQHDINKAVKVKRRKNGLNKPTGFVKELDLPKELADLIGVAEGTKISMPAYTKQFYAMLKSKNLLYADDGRVLRANEEIRKVFNLPESVNDSIDHKDKKGFNFYTLQKHIATVTKNLKDKKVQSK